MSLVNSHDLKTNRNLISSNRTHSVVSLSLFGLIPSLSLHEVKMAKTRWTRRKKTKALKDISTPSKYVPEVDVEENVVQEEERSEEEEANLGENDVEENEEKS